MDGHKYATQRLLASMDALTDKKRLLCFIYAGKHIVPLQNHPKQPTKPNLLQMLYFFYGRRYIYIYI